MIDTQTIIKIPRFIATMTINKTPTFLVPIHRYTDAGRSKYKVLIKASSRYAAMNIAISEFGIDGWIIDMNYENYEEL